MTDDYHGARLTADPRRAATWRSLWRHHFRTRIALDATVLDLGAGYGDFINAVVARRRIAVDRWPGLRDHVAPGVEAIISPVTDLSAVDTDSVDFAFASNLFEHLTQQELLVVLEQVARVLRPDGRLSMMQPNYRYAYREYWDDYTHCTAYSHIGLADLLRAHGWRVEEVKPRFLPLTVKSRLPAWDWLIAGYLRSPLKPLGKQMLLTARPPVKG